MKKVINCNRDDNPVINKKLKEVSVEEGLAIAEELFQILNKRGDGIGLAANQVGIDAQVAVVNVKEPIVLINPKIVSKEEEVRYHEGCLSFPLLYIKVKRPYGLIIECLDSKQKECTIELEGWNARIFGHEYDHLYGINYTDRVSKLRLNMAIKKRNKFVKRYKQEIIRSDNG